MRPTCVECRAFMKPEKNGVGVLVVSTFGPYQIWSADLWACPVCADRIITGYGKAPIAEHYQEGRFTHSVKWYEEEGLLYKVRDVEWVPELERE